MRGEQRRVFADLCGPAAGLHPGEPAALPLSLLRRLRHGHRRGHVSRWVTCQGGSCIKVGHVLRWVTCQGGSRVRVGHVSRWVTCQMWVFVYPTQSQGLIFKTVSCAMVEYLKLAEMFSHSPRKTALTGYVGTYMCGLFSCVCFETSNVHCPITALE